MEGQGDSQDEHSVAIACGRSGGRQDVNTWQQPVEGQGVVKMINSVHYKSKWRPPWKYVKSNYGLYPFPPLPKSGG